VHAAAPASNAIAASQAWFRLRPQILVVVYLISFLHSTG
jgi:hypothetical protein